MLFNNTGHIQSNEDQNELIIGKVVESSVHNLLNGVMTGGTNENHDKTLVMIAGLWFNNQTWNILNVKQMC
jgi:hypothetical protein